MPVTFSRQAERIQDKTTQKTRHNRNICTGGSTENLHLPALDWEKRLCLRYGTSVTALLGSAPAPLDSTNQSKICAWNCVPSHHLLILEKQGLCSFINNWTLPCSSISQRTFLSLASLHSGRRAVTIFMISIQSLSILYEAFLASLFIWCPLGWKGEFLVERERKKLWDSLFSPTWKDETALESLWHLKNYTVKRTFLAWKAGKRNWAKPSTPCLSSVPSLYH